MPPGVLRVCIPEQAGQRDREGIAGTKLSCIEATGHVGREIASPAWIGISYPSSCKAFALLQTPFQSRQEGRPVT